MSIAAGAGAVNPQSKNVLSQFHKNYLAERGVDPEFFAVVAGIRTVDAAEAGRLLGRPVSSGGLLVPYPNSPGYVRVRMDDDGGYIVPAGVEVPVYIPNNCQREGAVPLYVVEGPIKALAMQDQGFDTVGLGGVATTLTRARQLNASWQGLNVCRRDVFVVFDANRSINIEVARAEARLVRALLNAGARARVVALPLADGNVDQGPDDFLVSHGLDPSALLQLVAVASPGDPVERAQRVTNKADALVLLEDLPFLLAAHEGGAVVQEKIVDVLERHKVSRSLLRQAVKRASEGAKRPDKVLPAAGYETRDGRLCIVATDGVTERVEPLANFHAHVVEERLLDDGSGAPSFGFVLEGVHEDGSPLGRISVSPQEFLGDLWPTAKWGTRAIVSAGISRPAHHLANAIKAMSVDAPRVVAYAHTGFRSGDNDWFYLHAGGAVGASGVTLALEGTAARFVLPEADGDVASAVRASLELLGVADERITRPLHAAVYRAPLNQLQRCDTAVGIHGPSGGLKSSVVAVAQSHFGDFDYNSLPLSWESTANSLEADLFRLKDVLVTIDDFVPKADVYDEIHKKAERIFRAIGNGSARGRLQADLTARPDRPCRALVVTTGEDLPRGESVQARLVAIRMQRDDVNSVRLSSLQGKQERLPQAMRGYIEWLRPRMATLQTEVKEKYLEFRSQLNVVGHLRAPSAIAHLLVGAHYFAEYAKDLRVMTAAEAREYVDRARIALLANAREQVLATKESNPAHRFREVFCALFARGVVSLSDIGKKLQPRNEQGAEEIGWRDGEFAYVEPAAALRVVNRELAALNERQSLHSHGLWKRLAALGFIRPCGDEPTIKYNGDGKHRVRTLRIPLSNLLDPDPDPNPGPTGGDEFDPSRAWSEPDDDGSDAEPRACLRPLIRSRAVAQPAANDSPGHEPAVSPEESAHLGGPCVPGLSSSIPGLGRSGNDVELPSAQKPRRAEGRQLSTEASPAATSARAASSDSLPSGLGSRAAGRASREELVAAMLRAGAVGLAAGDSVGQPVLVAGVPDWGTALVEFPLHESVRDALSRVRLVGHGLKPIVASLHQNLVRPASVFDTKLAWRLQDGHQHEGDDFFSIANAVRLASLPETGSRDAREALDNEARDVLLLEPVFAALLEEDGLRDVASLEFSLLPVVAEMEVTGVAVDHQRWRETTEAWRAEAVRLRTALERDLGVQNVDNDKQVLVALRRLGLPVDQTNGQALAPYREHPVVQELALYRRRSAFVRSVGSAVLEAHGRSPDGRVRTNIRQDGARTGRMSCAEPNLMGLPREARVRGCIVAPPGRKLVVGDYRAIELRVIADQTGDSALRAVFANANGCPHRHTASVITGKREADVTPDEKNSAKALNFGLAFGMSTKTLVTYARKNFDVVMTEREAEAFKQKFFQHYAGIREWQKKTLGEMAQQLRTRSGRVAYYEFSDEGYNARLSFPIQGTAADGMKAAIVLLQPRLRALDAKIILAVHDELLIEVPDEHAEEASVHMRQCMVEGMQRYVSSVPIIVEPEVRSTWAG